MAEKLFADLIEEEHDILKSFVLGVKFIKDTAVYVGIQEKDSSRKEDKDITNAELAYIHTYGSPINNIPARPFLQPAIEKSADQINKHMKSALVNAIEGNKNESTIELEKAGMVGQNKTRAWFVNDDNGWAPNAPSVRARKIKKGSTNPRPLIDTGELRKSITYFVKRK